MKNVSAQQFIKAGTGIVTICGSTRFFDNVMECNKELTLNGWLVFMCGFWGNGIHKGLTFTEDEMSFVKLLHFHKILQSKMIVVVTDKTGYYGDSTREEIAFANDHNIPVFYFDGELFSGWEIVAEEPGETLKQGEPLPLIPNDFSDASLILPWRESYARSLSKAHKDVSYD